jgi:hypothetical protein
MPQKGPYTHVYADKKQKRQAYINKRPVICVWNQLLHPPDFTDEVKQFLMQVKELQIGNAIKNSYGPIKQRPRS